MDNIITDFISKLGKETKMITFGLYSPQKIKNNKMLSTFIFHFLRGRIKTKMCKSVQIPH